MLKTGALFLVLSLSSMSVYAQDYVDGIAKRSCECVGKIPSTGTKDQKTMQAGICILKSFEAEDKAKFKKDFGLDIGDFSRDGREIGMKIGVQMATQCPDLVMRMSSDIGDARESDITGTITKIETDPFVVFSVKDKNNVGQKILWLTSIVSPIDLPNNYQSLLGKTTTITYETKDIFDPKIGEYRRFKVMTQIK